MLVHNAPTLSLSKIQDLGKWQQNELEMNQYNLKEQILVRGLWENAEQTYNPVLCS